MNASSHQATAFWIVAPGRGELRREILPLRGEDEVTVRTLFSGISRGSESLVFRGDVPPSEYRRMRAPFQTGDFPAPVKYGYISVGTVEEGPPALVGKTVFCLYPHQTRYVVPADAVHLLPPGVPPERGVLAANLETAVNGLWDGAPRIGERIAVVGGGTLGCLVAWLASRIPGCTVELIDLNPDRAIVATTLGFEFHTPGDAEGEADLVVHTSGAPAGLNTALRLGGFEARVMEMSWFGTQPVPLALGEGFHHRRLTLQSSQVGTVAPAMRPRWNARKRVALSLSLLTEAKLDALITGEDRFSDLPSVLVRLSGESRGTLCHRIRYDG